ncbi:GAF and ANTAR domain-containing protein [Kineococcus esterisolvens]|uniref:GAF and ANTAR domain-containing protein n=1 Tax=unclassified Kineococcus TaxID=2621656 RepID=UPI003D7DBBDE
MTSVTDPTTPEEPVVALAVIAQQLLADVRRAQTSEQAHEAVVAACLTAAPGLAGVSVTVRRGSRASTTVSSHPLALRADEVQYGAGEGPCLEAIASGHVVDVPDLRRDARWPRAAVGMSEAGAASVLSVPLVAEDELEWAAGVNLYADHPRGFDAARRARIDVVAALAAASTAAHGHRERASNLQEAVASNRDIGAAVGILMALGKLTRDQALGELRRVSQHANRKLRDVADDVLRTGTLPEPATTRRPASH